MPAPIVAAAAGPKVIESATDDQGLINQAFKLTVLIALALAVGVGLFLIWRLTGVFADVVDVFDRGLNLIETFVSLPGAAFTAVFTMLPFGRQIDGFKRIFR